MFKFKASYVALAAALTSTLVYADPNTYTHMSGAKVVDIEAPNAAGVSHNMYREFNVGSKGMILNNSGVDVAHDTFGNIAKNNNLANGAASVILNEVVSNKASSLNGFIEVNGQKADVIIANPNGITCSGCSFVNTNKAVLTTGKVNLTDTGAIGSYTVTDGKLTIDGAGLDAKNNYAALLADAIKINGQVNAANTIIAAGNYTFNNQTGTVTSAGKSANLVQMLMPEYSIDITSLGGIKANSISMIGNNVGFGVRNKGAVVANSVLNIASNGTLINEGSITSNGLMTQIASAGELINSGSLSTNNMTTLTSYDKFTNKGSIINSSTLMVNAAKGIENKGDIKGNRLALSSNGDLTTASGSTVTADNQLAVSALGNIEHEGEMSAKSTSVSFGGKQIRAYGKLNGSTSLLVQSVQDNALGNGRIYINGATSGSDITLNTAGKVENDLFGRINASGTLATHSTQFENNGYINANTLNVTSNSAANYGGMYGNDMTITAQQGFINTETMRANHDIVLNAGNQSTITNQGSITAGNILKMDAKSVINGGYKCGILNLGTCGKGSMTADKLILTSSHQYASQMGGTQKFKNIETTTVK